MNIRALCVSVAALLAGCGATTTTTSYGDATADSTPAPFDVPLRTAYGEPVELSELHGHTVLLYLFATFDLPSQAALEPLREVAREHPELRVVGIALQPNAGELLPIFGSALEVEFPLAYEPENLLLRGLTDVGQIAGVPTYVLLDSAGFITQKAFGAMSAQALRQWCGLE